MNFLLVFLCIFSVNSYAMKRDREGPEKDERPTKFACTDEKQTDSESEEESIISWEGKTTTNRVAWEDTPLGKGFSGFKVFETVFKRPSDPTEPRQELTKENFEKAIEAFKELRCRNREGKLVKFCIGEGDVLAKWMRSKLEEFVNQDLTLKEWKCAVDDAYDQLLEQDNTNLVNNMILFLDKEEVVKASQCALDKLL